MIEIKAYKLGICCFCAKHAALWSKNWSARNLDNASEWRNMSTCRFFQWYNTIKVTLSMLVLY